MNAFHGDEKIKQKYIDRVREHRIADQLIKGTYWEDGKGCAVGCTVHSDNHSAYEYELGIPRLIARLEDGIFENLPNDLAMLWPEQFLDAINVGADLSMVFPKFMHFILADEKYGVLQYANTQFTKNAILKVIELYEKKINGADITREEWAAAYATATAAADADADAYATAAAYDYAYDYDDSGNAND